MRNRRPLRRKIQKPKHCYFTKNKIVPDYKDLDNIKKFVSERGRVTPRMYSGLCQKCQKDLAKAVKRARFMALIPFTVRPS
jgi:small subunit ribosomal protein S18